MSDFKTRTIRSGFAKAASQAVTFVLRIGSLMVLGRLLEPRDFGLVGMVTAVIGVFELFKDFGLSTATVQRSTVTEEQVSTLFWINVIVGAVLAALSLASAPVIALFYHEPRLFPVTAILSLGFLANATGIQHSAVLQRQMRFTALAAIEVVSLAAGIGAGISMAVAGYGYWALVAMTLSTPCVSTACLWGVTAWIPGRPRWDSSIGAALRFGGTLTLNSLVVYVAYNLEKVLLGRFWGAETIGLYGRAYQLINIPTSNINSSIGGVAFSALARLQDQPNRLKNYFLKCYAVVVAVTMAVTLMCALFADDLIAVLLGPKWKDAAAIFRLLAPTILIFGIINPLGWLLFSLGLVGRSLKIAFVIAPLVITAYVVGLPYGSRGVAFAYSAAMTIWLVPHIMWSVHGTGVTVREVFGVLGRPLLSGAVAAAVSLLVAAGLGPISAFARLLACGVVFSGAYGLFLTYALRQKELYRELFRGLRPAAAPEAGVCA
jgi:O-antigen/teichoic acid export membrane protein